MQAKQVAAIIMFLFVCNKERSPPSCSINPYVPEARGREEGKRSCSLLKWDERCCKILELFLLVITTTPTPANC